MPPLKLRERDPRPIVERLLTDYEVMTPIDTLGSLFSEIQALPEGDRELGINLLVSNVRAARSAYIARKLNEDVECKERGIMDSDTRGFVGDDFKIANIYAMRAMSQAGIADLRCEMELREKRNARIDVLKSKTLGESRETLLRIDTDFDKTFVKLFQAVDRYDSLTNMDVSGFDGVVSNRQDGVAKKLQSSEIERALYDPEEKLEESLGEKATAVKNFVDRTVMRLFEQQSYS